MPLFGRDWVKFSLNQTASFETSDKHIQPSAVSLGFTVLELLLVLAIVMVLCALILPAVQQSREAARQVQCKQQLHQIGVALHAYHTKTSCLPSGWIIEVPVAPDSQNGWGWLAMLLPQMDQN